MDFSLSYRGRGGCQCVFPLPLSFLRSTMPCSTASKHNCFLWVCIGVLHLCVCVRARLCVWGGGWVWGVCVCVCCCVRLCAFSLAGDRTENYKAAAEKHRPK